MSQEFIQKEVDKVINESGYDAPLSYAMASAWLLGNLKGINLKVLDIAHTSSLADFYVLASATNNTQAQAMAAEITRHLKRHDQTIMSKEGVNNSDWILLDAGNVIVHIFLEAAREVYALEEVLKEAKTVTIPQDYYFSSDDAEEAQNLKDSKGRDFF